MSERTEKFIYLHMPVLIFGGVWFLVYLLYFIELFKLDKIHGYTWAILLSSNVLLLLGYYVTYHFHGFGKSFYSYKRGYVLQFDNRKLIKLIIFLFIVSFIGSLLSVYLRAVEVGGLVEYFSNPIRARFITVSRVKETRVEWQYIETFLSFFKNMNYVSMILSGIVLSSAKKYRFVVILPILVTIFDSLATFSRNFFIRNLFLLICSAFFTTVYLNHEDKKKAIRAISKIMLTSLIIVIVYFIFIIVFRNAIFYKSALTTQKIMEYIGKSIHSYFVGNIVMMDWYLMEDIEFYYGVSLFRNIIRWFKVTGIYENLRIPYLLSHHEFIQTRYLFMNTYSYIRYLYEDFGEAGLAILSFLWGALSYRMVASYLRKFSLVKLYVLSLMCYALFISFFSFQFKMIIMPIYCGIVLYFIERTTNCFTTNEASD